MREKQDSNVCCAEDHHDKHVQKSRGPVKTVETAHPQAQCSQQMKMKIIKAQTAKPK